MATDTGEGHLFDVQNYGCCVLYCTVKQNFFASAQLFWMATQLDAKSLKLNNEIANIQIGNFADFITINLSSTNLIKQRRGALVFGKNFSYYNYG